MKRILFTTVSLGVLGLMSPVLAADLPTYSKAPALASPIYDWSGFYVGGFGGGGFGNHNLNDGTNITFANFSTNYSSQGGIGGGEVGYNAQSGNYLVGIEADGFGSGIKGNDASQALAVVDTTNLRWGGTLRARGGIAADRLLLFFTGGWAFGDLNHTGTAPGVTSDNFTTHRSGLAAGGGIAYALTNNLSTKIEYRYYDYGTYARPGLAAAGQLPFTVANTYSVVTLGLDFKFGGPAPVVAKY
jgi:outer membrane immunogenic protein